MDVLRLVRDVDRRRVSIHRPGGQVAGLEAGVQDKVLLAADRDVRDCLQIRSLLL